MDRDVANVGTRPLQARHTPGWISGSSRAGTLPRRGAAAHARRLHGGANRRRDGRWRSAPVLRDVGSGPIASDVCRGRSTAAAPGRRRRPAEDGAAIEVDRAVNPLVSPAGGCLSVERLGRLTLLAVIGAVWRAMRVVAGQRPTHLGSADRGPHFCLTTSHGPAQIEPETGLASLPFFLRPNRLLARGMGVIKLALTGASETWEVWLSTRT
jgi:hypothetical protein